MIHQENVVVSHHFCKMTFVSFLILFVLGCLFTCEGKVSLLNGTNVTLAPGTTGRIVGSYDDTIKRASYRLWTFISSNGNQEDLASLIGINGNYTKLTSLYEFAAETPATLVLKNVNISYNGTYKFSLVPSDDGIESVVVYIAVKPTVTVCSSPIMVNEGEDVTCECQGRDGNPPADVTWYKADSLLQTGKEEITLTLRNVSEKEGGSYKCVAQSYPSIMFKDEKIVEVKVKLNYKPNKPVITLPPNNVASLGEMVTITCKTDGLPQPNYTIFHNGTAVSHDKPHIIPEVNLTHSGNYTCTTKNKLGRNSTSAILFVKGTTTPTSNTSTPNTSKSNTTTATPTPSGKVKTTDDDDDDDGTNIGLIVGIIIGVLVFLLIIGVVVYCYKSKEKDSRNRANIDPVPGNDYELENEEPGPGDGAYDSVGPVGASSSKSKPPAGNTLPPVYAAVDKNNRQGNTLYASLDTEALQTSRASKKEPDRPPQAEYASIDFGKSAPKADLV